MRVLLADDEIKVRSALRLLLEQQPGLVLVGEAEEWLALLKLAHTAQPDLVLLDWELPGGAAEKLIGVLQKQDPHLLLLALSGRPEARQAALSAGADAFVSKGDPPEMILAALLAVGAAAG